MREKVKRNPDVINSAQRKRLEGWLEKTCELFADIHHPHNGESPANYLLRSVDELLELISAQTHPEFVITVFRRLWFPIRGKADEALLRRALEDIPDDRWFHILRPEVVYPTSCEWCGSGKGHDEIRQQIASLHGEWIGLGEHPFDRAEDWGESNPDEALVFKRQID